MGIDVGVGLWKTEGERRGKSWRPPARPPRFYSRTFQFLILRAACPSMFMLRNHVPRNRSFHPVALAPRIWNFPLMASVHQETKSQRVYEGIRRRSVLPYCPVSMYVRPRVPWSLVNEAPERSVHASRCAEGIAHPPF